MKSFFGIDKNIKNEDDDGRMTFGGSEETQRRCPRGATLRKLTTLNDNLSFFSFSRETIFDKFSNE